MKKIKSKWMLSLMAMALLSGCATAQNASTPMVADEMAKKGVEASENTVLEAIKGFKEKYKVEQGIDPEVLTYYLECDKEIIENVTVDDSKVKWNTPGTYDAIYTIEAVLPDSDEEKIEITEKVPVQIMTPEEVEEDKKNGGDAISKEDFENDKAEDNKKPAQPETKPAEDDKQAEVSKPEESKPSEDNKKPETGTTSKPTTSTNKPETPSNPTEHTHKWEAQYKTVHHAEVGHNEQYVIKEAWTESYPIYEEVALTICNTCGADITGNVGPHIKNHMLNGENGSYRTEWVYRQVGVDTITHPTEYGTRYVIDQAAYDEQVLTGYKCSCGSTKKSIQKCKKILAPPFEGMILSYSEKSN